MNNDYNEVFKFLNIANRMNKKFWIRQVIVPGLMDNEKYLISLKKYINDNIKNVERIDFLPYHKLGSEKYEKLDILNPYKDLPEMDFDECKDLFEKFMKM